MKGILIVAAVTWSGLWFTPDQRGQRLFRRGEFIAAAPGFRRLDVAGERLVSCRGIRKIGADIRPRQQRGSTFQSGQCLVDERQV